MPWSRLLLFSFLPLVLPAYGQLQSPDAGVVRYPSGQVRHVLGLNHSYVTGPLIWSKAVAAAFSLRSGLIFDGTGLTHVELTAADVTTPVTVDVAEPHPTLGAEAAFLPSTQTLLIWERDRFTAHQLNLRPDTQVASLFNADGSLHLLLHSGSTWQLATFNNASQRFEEGAPLATPANTFFVWNSCSFTVNDGKLQAVSDHDPEPVRIAANQDAAALVFEPAGSALHILSRTGRRHWLAFLVDGHLGIAELPGVPQ